jgi:isopenicillin-N N-acyltransferase-like protein
MFPLIEVSGSARERGRQHGLQAKVRIERSIADLQRMLRDEADGYLSICRSPDPPLAPEACIESVASVVMDLGARVMHVAPDVPSRVDYVPVALGVAVPA